MSHAWSHASPCSFSMYFSIFSRKRGFSLKGGGDSDIHYPMCHLLFFRYWQHCSFTSKSRGFSKISLAIHFAKSRAGSFPRSSIHFCLSFFLMLEYEPRVFCMLGKYCTTHLYPQPLSITLERQLKYYLISKTLTLYLCLWVSLSGTSVFHCSVVLQLSSILDISLKSLPCLRLHSIWKYFPLFLLFLLGQSSSLCFFYFTFQGQSGLFVFFSDFFILSWVLPFFLVFFNSLWWHSLISVISLSDYDICEKVSCPAN